MIELMYNESEIFSLMNDGLSSDLRKAVLRFVRLVGLEVLVNKTAQDLKKAAGSKDVFLVYGRDVSDFYFSF